MGFFLSRVMFYREHTFRKYTFREAWVVHVMDRKYCRNKRRKSFDRKCLKANNGVTSDHGLHFRIQLVKSCLTRLMK